MFIPSTSAGSGACYVEDLLWDLPMSLATPTFYQQYLLGVPEVATTPLLLSVPCMCEIPAGVGKRETTISLSPAFVVPLCLELAVGALTVFQICYCTDIVLSALI